MEETCDNCGRTSMNGGLGCDVLYDCAIDTHSHWQPIEKPKEEKTCAGCKPQKPKPPKQKENKMWKKLRYYGRRIETVWLLIGIYWLCKLANPYAFWYGSKGFNLVNHERELDPMATEDMARAWFFTAISIAAILAALYGLDRLAAWWYGEEK